MAKFEIKKMGNGQYYFVLKASGNNETILKSEGYVTKSGCQNGIDSVKANAPYDARYEREYSINKQYYFNLKASNGERIGTSETYTTSYSRDNGISVVKAQAPTATVSDLT